MEIKNHSLYKSMEVDTVLSSIFNTYFKKFLVLFAPSFIAVFLIQVVFYQLGFWELYNIDLSDEAELLTLFSQLMSKIAIVSVVSVVIYGILNAFLVNYLIKSDISPNNSASDIFIESIKKYSIHMIFFLILSTLILLAGFLFGLIVFIVGSLIAFVYLGTILIPGMTIIIAEDKNAIEVIGRTFKLTHKDFWSVLGALIIFILIMILISLVLTALMAIPFIFSLIENWSDAESIQELFRSQMYNLGIWSVVYNSLISALTYPLYAILSVVLYFKLIFVEDQKTNKLN